MEKKEFLSHLAQIFEVPEEKMTMGFVLSDGEWDSLASMATMAGIDKFYDAVVPVKEIVKCRTVADLMELVEDAVREKA